MEIQQIINAAEIIKSGELVAFPTETVYGLGADALNPYAVAKIFAEKERPSFDPLIVHIADLSQLGVLTASDDDRIMQLAKTFWPGPLTLVLPKSTLVPDIVTSGLPTVAVRMPDNSIALELIRRSGCPIAAPSANKFGRISPTTAEHVRKQLMGVKCILDGGPAKIGIESTVAALNEDGFVILRHGFITGDDLKKVLPASKFDIVKENKLASPGLLKSHYSPRKPIYIIGQSKIDIDKSKAGLITFTGNDVEGYKTVKYLSERGDLKEAAVNLFAALHYFEDADVEYIVAEPVRAEGIGAAIMDRLNKAAYQYIKY